MNEWQLLRQAKYLLQRVTWDDGSTLVFHGGSVLVFPGVPEDTATETPKPAVFLWPSGGESDREAPDLVTQRIGAALMADILGDQFGETALLGAHRQSINSSRGRGLLELEEKLHDAIGRIVGADGVRLQMRARSSAQIESLGGTSHVLIRLYEFEGIVTRDRYYAPATRMTSTGGTGSTTLGWTLPAARYDRLRVILRRASGSTAPSSATSGTGVTLASDLATGVTDSPGSGTWSYALFVAYDETGSGSPERYSEALTKTVSL